MPAQYAGTHTASSTPRNATQSESVGVLGSAVGFVAVGKCGTHFPAGGEVPVFLLSLLVPSLCDVGWTSIIASLSPGGRESGSGSSVPVFPVAAAAGPPVPLPAPAVLFCPPACLLFCSIWTSTDSVVEFFTPDGSMFVVVRFRRMRIVVPPSAFSMVSTMLFRGALGAVGAVALGATGRTTVAEENEDNPAVGGVTGGVSVSPLPLFFLRSIAAKSLRAFFGLPRSRARRRFLIVVVSCSSCTLALSS
mmetsp:Transcript_18250/g.45628  ORF Transcript_18250/g.45628 Transcript_18250/m.45628 type:complete len:249 (-) Transcript_18250:467-1213(-)